MMGYGMMGLGLIGLFFNIVIVVGIIVLIVWAVRRFSEPGSRPMSGGQTPREIVQTRYARGEITREQYQQMLDDLK